jgi:hypothetical protein
VTAPTVHLLFLGLALCDRVGVRPQDYPPSHVGIDEREDPSLARVTCGACMRERVARLARYAMIPARDLPSTPSVAIFMKDNEPEEPNQ